MHPSRFSKRVKMGTLPNGSIRGYTGVVGGEVTGPKLNGTVVPDSGGEEYPAYKEGTPYKAGDTVSNRGKNYRCKPHPFTAWCADAAWAYAPGTGTAWDQAWDEVSALDLKIPAAAQTALYQEISTVLRRQTFWLARRAVRPGSTVEALIAAYRPAADTLRAVGGAVLSRFEQSRLKARVQTFVSLGAPEAMVELLRSNPFRHVGSPDSRMARFAALVRRVPCYRLELSPDGRQNGRALRALLETMPTRGQAVA